MNFRPKKTTVRRWLGPLSRHGALILMAIFFSLPLLVMFFSSLKTPEELARNPYALLPETWRWQNYSDAMSTVPWWRYLFNSMLLCTGCVIGSLISCSLTAWSLAWIEWRGRRVAFALIVATMLLPWQLTMIPRFTLISALGLYDSLWAIILPCFVGDAFYIFLLRQFFLTIPKELLEAGRVDGLSHFGLFWRIGLPLSRPAIATVAVFQFVATWNDFGGPLLYLDDPEKFPLAYGLERFVSSYGDQTQLLLAASVMFTIPVILLFFLAQRTFIQGISTVGVKG